MLRVSNKYLPLSQIIIENIVAVHNKKETGAGNFPTHKTEPSRRVRRFEGFLFFIGGINWFRPLAVCTTAPMKGYVFCNVGGKFLPIRMSALFASRKSNRISPALFSIQQRATEASKPITAVSATSVCYTFKVGGGYYNGLAAIVLIRVAAILQKGNLHSSGEKNFILTLLIKK